jgi:hypothetical protein
MDIRAKHHGEYLFRHPEHVTLSQVLRLHEQKLSAHIGGIKEIEFSKKDDNQLANEAVAAASVRPLELCLDMVCAEHV